MRTTLDIAEDVLLAVKARARRQGLSAGEVLSEVARAGLTRTADDGDSLAEEPFFGFEPRAARGRVISNELIDKLREQDGE